MEGGGGDPPWPYRERDIMQYCNGMQREREERERVNHAKTYLLT